jgi:hypothetical protein
MAPMPEEAPVIRAVSFRFFFTLSYKQPSGHSQPFESMRFSQPRSASVSANADGSADDEQAGIAQD